MHHSEIWEDIHISVRRAINDRLDLLSEAELVARSDLLLASLPVVGGTDTVLTTQMLLQRYHAHLHQELCTNGQPRRHFNDLTEELTELTRATIVTLDSSEGISVENAVLIALILRLYGVANFCAQPVPVAGI